MVRGTAVLVIATALCIAEEEPIYKGKKLGEWIKQLEIALDTRDKLTAIKACMMLGEKARPAVPVMIKLLQHPEKEVRTWALMSFKRILPVDPSAAGMAMIPFLDDPDVGIRMKAASSMRMMNFVHKDALQGLQDAMANPDPGLKRAAAMLLGLYVDYSSQVAPALIEGLSNEDSSVVRACPGALGRMGEPAKPAIPKLVKLSTRRPNFRMRLHWPWRASAPRQNLSTVTSNC